MRAFTHTHTHTHARTPSVRMHLQRTDRNLLESVKGKSNPPVETCVFKTNFRLVTYTQRERERERDRFLSAGKPLEGLFSVHTVRQVLASTLQEHLTLVFHNRQRFQGQVTVSPSTIIVFLPQFHGASQSYSYGIIAGKWGRESDKLLRQISASGTPNRLIT